MMVTVDEWIRCIHSSPVTTTVSHSFSLSRIVSSNKKLWAAQSLPLPKMKKSCDKGQARLIKITHWFGPGLANKSAFYVCLLIYIILESHLHLLSPQNWEFQIGYLVAAVAASPEINWKLRKFRPPGSLHTLLWQKHAENIEKYEHWFINIFKSCLQIVVVNGLLILFLLWALVAVCGEIIFWGNFTFKNMVGDFVPQ